MFRRQQYLEIVAKEHNIHGEKQRELLEVAKIAQDNDENRQKVDILSNTAKELEESIKQNTTKLKELTSDILLNENKLNLIEVNIKSSDKILKQEKEKQKLLKNESLKIEEITRKDKISLQNEINALNERKLWLKHDIDTNLITIESQTQDIVENKNIIDKQNYDISSKNAIISSINEVIKEKEKEIGLKDAEKDKLVEQINSFIEFKQKINQQ